MTAMRTVTPRLVIQGETGTRPGKNPSFDPSDRNRATRNALAEKIPEGATSRKLTPRNLLKTGCRRLPAEAAALWNARC